MGHPEIKIEILPGSVNASEDESVNKEILPGEVENVSTFYRVEAGENARIACPKDRLKIIIFLRGKAVLRNESADISIPGDEISTAIIYPGMTRNILIESGPLEFIELHWLLIPEEVDSLRNREKPYFVKYHDCKTYREDIKSEKTVSRMIVPEDLVPRFCMGSVETEGPDEVGAHKHPMLEQLFLGLKDNRCTVSADGSEQLFIESTLLHVPLGSEHGVKVVAGNRLHYIWIDFFRNAEDVAYIAKMHGMVDD